MNEILSILLELLETGHPPVIHFPIIGIMMAFAAGATALVISIFVDLFEGRDFLTPERKELAEKFIDRYGFASWILDFMGIVGLVVAAITGFQAAGSVETAISSDLLAYKIKLTIYVFFLLLTPLLFKLYMWRIGHPIFGESKIIPILYLLPMAIAAFLTMLISGAGGRYTYGHSILDTVGLGWLLP